MRSSPPGFPPENVVREDSYDCHSQWQCTIQSKVRKSRQAKVDRLSTQKAANGYRSLGLILLEGPQSSTEAAFLAGLIRGELIRLNGSQC